MVVHVKSTSGYHFIHAYGWLPHRAWNTPYTQLANNIACTENLYDFFAKSNSKYCSSMFCRGKNSCKENRASDSFDISMIKLCDYAELLAQNALGIKWLYLVANWNWLSLFPYHTCIVLYLNQLTAIYLLPIVLWFWTPYTGQDHFSSQYFYQNPTLRLICHVHTHFHVNNNKTAPVIIH